MTEPLLPPLALVSKKDYSNPMTGFTKLFSGLVHSTVWREEMHVKVLWITMLALTDRNGHVAASLPGLADAARITLEQAQDGLARLSAPDPYSRTKLYEGRRVEEIDGGWKILNYAKYRELRNKDERRLSNREAVARHRSKKSKSLTVSDVSHGHPPSSQAEAEAEAEAEAPTTTTGASRAVVPVPKAEAVIWAKREDTIFEQDRRLRVEAGARLVFEYFRAAMGKGDRYLWNDKDKARIVARLRENAGNVSELFYAIDGAKRDDWIMGRANGSKGYKSVETVLRDRAQVNRFVELAKAGDDPPPHPTYLAMAEAHGRS